MSKGDAAVTSRERSSLPAVDYIKSAAILAVLVQHAVPTFFDRPFIPSETMIFGIVGFHVPAFLFLAGFLSHADTPVTWREVGARLRRVVPPYLVATAVAVMFGFVASPTLRRLVFVTVTGAAFGHYYFVPVLVLCVLLLPAFSRMSTASLIGATLMILVAAEWMWSSLEWRLAYPMFWQVRHPILQFHLGFFLLGVIAARLRPTLEQLGTRYRFVLMGIAGVCVVLNAGLGYGNEVVFHPVLRTTYMLSVMVLIAECVSGNPAAPAIRFLSAATFTIYLYHWFVYDPVARLLPDQTPIALGILARMCAGLTFATSIALLGRRVLGSRSRTLLGT